MVKCSGDGNCFILNIVRKFFRWTIAWYLLAGVVMVGSVNSAVATRNRLNQLKVYESAVRAFAEGRKSLNPEDLPWALRYYQKCAKISPKESLLQGNIGFCYFYLGELTRAQQAIRQAIKLAPNWYFYYMDLGTIALAQGEYQRAIPLFNEALAVIPATLSHYQKISDRLEQRIGAPAQMVAVTLPERARRDEEQMVARVAECYFFLKEYRPMFDYLQAGLTLYPQSSWLNHLAGVAKYSLGDKVAAVNFFSKAIELNSKAVETFYWRSRCFKEFGDEAKMTADLRQILRLTKAGVQERKLGVVEVKPHFYADLMALIYQ